MNTEWMDYEAVLRVAKGFGQVGETLDKVASVLQTAINILNATAFIGLVGGAAVKLYLERILPEVKKGAKMCRDLMGKLQNSAKEWKEAEEATKQKFGEGLR